MDASAVDTLFRLAVAAGCCLLVGLDLVVIVVARRLFSAPTWKAWRFFFVGKLLMTAYVAAGLFSAEWIGRAHSIADWQFWRAPLAVGGIAASATGLIVLLRYYSRSALPHERHLNGGDRAR